MFFLASELPNTKKSLILDNKTDRTELRHTKKTAQKTFKTGTPRFEKKKKMRKPFLAKHLRKFYGLNFSPIELNSHIYNFF